MIIEESGLWRVGIPGSATNPSPPSPHGNAAGARQLPINLKQNDKRVTESIEAGRLGPATKAIALPESKPRAMRQELVVASICRREVAGAHGPRVGRGEDALEPLDLGNRLFRLHEA